MARCRKGQVDVLGRHRGPQACAGAPLRPPLRGYETGAGSPHLEQVADRQMSLHSASTFLNPQSTGGESRAPIGSVQTPPRRWPCATGARPIRPSSSTFTAFGRPRRRTPRQERVQRFVSSAAVHYRAGTMVVSFLQSRRNRISAEELISGNVVAPTIAGLRQAAGGVQAATQLPRQPPKSGPPLRVGCGTSDREGSG